MAIGTPASAQVFFTQLDSIFWQAFTLAEVWHSQLMTERPIDGEVWTDGWIGQLDVMRPWYGSRVVHEPAVQTYSATVEPYELTEGLDIFKLRDDKNGLYNPVVPMMGMSVAKQPDYLLRNLIENSGNQTGARQIGLDGVTYWNAAHPVDFYDASKGTYVNDYGAAGTSIGGVTCGGLFGPTPYATLVQDFMNRKGPSGEKLGVRPTHTMVPTQLKLAAKTVLQATIIGTQALAGTTMVGSTTNALANDTDLIVNPDLTSQLAWYAFDLSRPVKPFIKLVREPANFVYRNQTNDPVVFDRHQMLIGADMRMNPALSHAFLAARSGV